MGARTSPRVVVTGICPWNIADLLMSDSLFTVRRARRSDQSEPPPLCARVCECVFMWVAFKQTSDKVIVMTDNNFLPSPRNRSGARDLFRKTGTARATSHRIGRVEHSGWEGGTDGLRFLFFCLFIYLLFCTYVAAVLQSNSTSKRNQSPNNF